MHGETGLDGPQLSLVHRMREFNLTLVFVML